MPSSARRRAVSCPIPLFAPVTSAVVFRFTLDVAITEAIATFTSFFGTARAPSHSLRPSVRRAREFLLDHVAEDVTLDAVADHARADKFHLCRAFSREIGFPPYAFLTQARIARARILLQRGMRAAEVASLVGFCDQSQMHRHFLRIVGLHSGRIRTDVLTTHEVTGSERTASTSPKTRG